jgi:hypothetical protein
LSLPAFCPEWYRKQLADRFGKEASCKAVTIDSVTAAFTYYVKKSRRHGLAVGERVAHLHFEESHVSVMAYTILQQEPELTFDKGIGKIFPVGSFDVGSAFRQLVEDSILDDIQGFGDTDDVIESKLETIVNTFLRVSARECV